MPLLCAHTANVFQFAFELQQFTLDLSPVGFQLSFSRSAGPDAAAELRHGRATAGQPGQHVLQLREFYLQLTFAAARVAGKDVENELGAIDHPYRQRVFQVPELGWGQIVIEENQGSLRRLRDCGDLLYFAFADQGCRVRLGPSLQHFGDNFRARTSDQLAKFSKRCSRVGVCRRGSWTGCIAAGSRDFRQLCGFPRQCSRTRNGRRPRDELDTDQQRPVRRNASVFQQTLIETAADPALAFRHRAVRARPAKARSARGRMTHPSARTMITVQHGTRADHRGDGMLENQLLLAVVFEQHRIFVK